MVKVKESTLRTAAGEGMDEFLNVLTDAYLEAVGGQLTAEAMPLLSRLLASSADLSMNPLFYHVSQKRLASHFLRVRMGA